MRRIISSSANIINEKSKQYAVYCAKLDSLSPLAVLGRGYAVAKYGEDVIKSVKNVNIGDKINVVLSDGTINCITESIDSKGIEKNG